MSAFWLIAAVLVAAAAACILAPLWLHQPEQQAGLSQEEANTQFFRERLADLDTELRERRIGAAQYQSLRAELERTLLDDMPQENAPRRAGGMRALGTAAAVVAPLLALGHYYIGSYRGEAGEWIALQSRLDAAVQRAMRQPREFPEEAHANLPDFVRVLQTRVLREGMNDADSLFLLGRGLVRLQLTEQAVLTLRRALRLAPARTDIKMGYAQALLLANDGKLNEVIARLLHAVLQSEPAHQGALMMLGLGARNAGDHQTTLYAWRSLLEKLEPDSEAANMLRDSIARVERDMEAAAEAAAEAAPAAPAAGTKASITVTVEVAPALETRVASDDTLFIFAKAAAGPPMPLAAVRQRARNFPVRVVLDDDKAMLPEMRLSAFREVVVGARISKAGDVMARPGDLEGLSDTLDLSQGPRAVALTIDRVLP